MAELSISREDTSSGGRYTGRLAGYPDAEMTFSKAGDALMIIDHTAVPDELRGMGAGAQLVAKAVEDARRDGVKILPLCPFAKAQFGKHPEWSDVLKGGG